MPETSSTYHQTSFRGGEWGPLSQGRSDLPGYHTAMNVCLNGIPVEEGAWVRRSGTRFLGPTYNRVTARALPFVNNSDDPYTLVLTASGGTGRMHFYYGLDPVYDSTAVVSTSSSTAGVLTITFTTSPSWAVGDQIRFTGLPAAGGAYVNRVLTVATAATPTFTFKDDQGTAFSFDTAANACAAATAHRLYVVTPHNFTTTANFPKIRIIQSGRFAILVERAAAPMILSNTTEGVESATFTLTDMSFIDGPYLDGVDDQHTGTVSAYSGSGVTLTPTDGTTFTADDVGRIVRLFSEPADWASGTTYAYGDRVKYDGSYWVNVAQNGYTNVGIIPGTVPPLATGVAIPLWNPDPTAAVWAWAKITAQATTSCTIAFQTDSRAGASDTLNSSNGSTVTFLLGLYTVGQYPSCGAYHEGRLWLAGAVRNRVDASCAGNDENVFSPTDQYGNVLDSSAISRTLVSEQRDQFLWMAEDHQGLVAGTPGGERLITASNNNDILTPYTIQSPKMTKLGSTEALPVRAGLALLFVKVYGRRVVEYLADAFSSRFSGRHLNEYAKHLTPVGVRELAYQEEPVPIVWANLNDDTLTGCTYRRLSRFINEPPEIEAWHRHQIADNGRKVTGLCVVPDTTTTGHNLLMTTSANGTGAGYGVEFMQPLLQETDYAWQAGWFLDCASPGLLAVSSGGSGTVADTTLTIYGNWHLAGQSVEVCVGGIAMGSHTVAANGSVAVTYATDSGALMTPSYLETLTADAVSGAAHNVTFDVYDGSSTVSVTVPILVGANYTSEGQLLRPATQEDIKSRTGAALAQIRRTHEYGFLLQNAISLDVGTDFTTMYATRLSSDGRATPELLLGEGSAYNGVYRDALEDASSFDGMLCWRINRPWPCMIMAASSFLNAAEP